MLIWEIVSDNIDKPWCYEAIKHNPNMKPIYETEIPWRVIMYKPEFCKNWYELSGCLFEKTHEQNAQKVIARAWRRWQKYKKALEKIGNKYNLDEFLRNKILKEYIYKNTPSPNAK